MADVHGDRFRLNIAWAISKSIAGAPVLEVPPYSAVDTYDVMTTWQSIDLLEMFST
jgi:hypothetical protein